MPWCSERDTSKVWADIAQRAWSAPPSTGSVCLANFAKELSPRSKSKAIVKCHPSPWQHRDFSVDHRIFTGLGANFWNPRLNHQLQRDVFVTIFETLLIWHPPPLIPLIWPSKEAKAQVIPSGFKRFVTKTLSYVCSFTEREESCAVVNSSKSLAFGKIDFHKPKWHIYIYVIYKQTTLCFLPK